MPTQTGVSRRADRRSRRADAPIIVQRTPHGRQHERRDERLAARRRSRPRETRAAATASPRSVDARSGIAARERRAADAARRSPCTTSEIAKLRAIVKQRRAQLDPKTVAVLEQSIAVIDSAIAQSRAALAKDPASGFLATNSIIRSRRKSSCCGRRRCCPRAPRG